NRRRGLNVYTPPGYELDPSSRYPVLYLLHGAGDNEATWTAFGHAHLILDNLLAQRKIKPMIVVMPDGHAASFGPPPAAAPARVAVAASGQPPGDGSSRPAAPAGRGAGGPGAGMARNVEAFEREILGDIIPFVEGNYRVRSEPASRAIAGLSMG